MSNCSKWLFTFLLLCMMFSCAGEEGTDKDKDSSAPSQKTFDGKFLPKEAREYFSKHLPDVEFLDTSLYVSDWLTYYEKNQLPYFVTLDLNGDQKSDYSVLVSRKNKLNLIVLLSDANGLKHYLAKVYDILYSSEDKKVQFGLAIQEAELVYGLNGQAVQLEHQGISLFKFGASSELFYWKDGRLQSLVTGT